MTLRPLFAALALALLACASTPRNPVLDKYPVGISGRTSVIYYDVHGSSYDELRADMRRLGPKVSGTSFVGETRSPMQWSWRAETTGPSSCVIQDVRVSMNAQILLPRWTPPPGADSALVAEWKRFITALEVHEAGHKDISARAGNEIMERLRGMSGPCSQISMRAGDIARSITDRARDEQANYDARTRHGLTQGTTFGPPRALGARTVSASRAAMPAPTNDSIQKAVAVAMARGDSETNVVTRLVVSPDSLALQVGDSLSLLMIYSRLDVRGVTTSGDTVRGFARSYALDPGKSIQRIGRMIVARRPGEAEIWIVLGPDPRPDARDTMPAVRLPIHVHAAPPPS